MQPNSISVLWRNALSFEANEQDAIPMHMLFAYHSLPEENDHITKIYLEYDGSYPKRITCRFTSKLNLFDSCTLNGKTLTEDKLQRKIKALV